MGVDVKVRKPLGLNETLFFESCRNIPIDAEINHGWIRFHFAYWGIEHVTECERFVKRFSRRHHVKIGRWSY